MILQWDANYTAHTKEVDCNIEFIADHVKL